MAPAALLIVLAGSASSHLMLDDSPLAAGELTTQATTFAVWLPGFPETASDGHAHPSAWPEAPREFTLRWEALDIQELTTTRTEMLRVRPDGWSGSSLWPRTTTATENVRDLQAMSIRCHERCLVQIANDGPARLTLSTTTQAPLALPAPDTRLPEVTTEPFARATWSRNVADALLDLGARTDPSRLRVDGSYRIIVWDAVATLTTSSGTREIATGEDEAPEGPLRDAAMTIAELRAHGPLQIDFGGNPSGILGLADPVYHVDGKVAALKSTGTLSLPGQRVPLRSDAVLISGLVSVTPTCQDATLAIAAQAPECEYEIQGAVTNVHVNGRSITRERLVATSLLASVSAALLLGLARLGDALRTALATLHFRVRKDKALENPQRRRLHELVQATPGIHFNELLRLSGLSHGSLMHHLRVMSQFKLVRSQEAGGLRLYWPTQAETTPQAAQRAVALARERARALAARVAASPGLTQRELARIAGIPQASVSYHLRRLAAAGLVEARAARAGGRRLKQYFPLPDLVALQPEPTPDDEAHPQGPARSGRRAQE